MENINIKNKREFSKLFSINIPVERHFDYYINTLLLSPEYNSLGSRLAEKIRVFEEFEEFIKETDGNIGNYKLGKGLHSIKDDIVSSKAYKTILDFDYSKETFYSKDVLKSHEQELLISFDIKKANYSILKAFDVDGQFSAEWSDYVKNMDLHKALGLSKGFRQVIFGNINPKRFQKIQQLFILNFVEFLKNEGISEDDIISISHDEVIVKPKSESASHIEDLLKYNKAVLGDKTVELVPTIFKMKKIKDTKGYVKEVFNIADIGFGGKHLITHYEKLFGVQGKKFFMYFKKEILHTEIEERDILFIEDGMLAKWIIETK